MKLNSADSNSKSKFQRLDPRKLYKAFASGIVFPVDEEKSDRDDTTSNFRYPKPLSSISTSKDFHLTRFELMSSKVAFEEDKATETLRCLWPFFQLSRIIGLCPITRQGNHLVVAKFYHPSWLITYISLIVQGIMVLNSSRMSIRAIIASDNDVVEHINAVIYYAHTFLNCIYMAVRIKELPKFLISCKRIETLVKKHQRKDLKPDGLVRHCYFAFLFFSVTQAIGNVLFYIQIVYKGKVKSIPQFFQTFNAEFLEQRGHYYTGIYFCFAELFCDMGWTFADILLGLICIIFGRFFTRLNAILATKRAMLSLPKIEELRLDHREICHLVQLCNNLFSPLFLLTYLANVAYLFTRLYVGLAADLNHSLIAVRIESLYAFCFQILIKILLPTYLASRLHEKAHEGLKLIHNWPSTVDTPDSKYRLLVIGRFVSQLVTTPVGISGCGYFIISKSFMVTLISALVTYEVIILQFQGASLRST